MITSTRDPAALIGQARRMSLQLSLWEGREPELLRQLTEMAGTMVHATAVALIEGRPSGEPVVAYLAGQIDGAPAKPEHIAPQRLTDVLTSGRGRVERCADRLGHELMIPIGRSAERATAMLLLVDEIDPAQAHVLGAVAAIAAEAYPRWMERRTTGEALRQTEGLRQAMKVLAAINRMPRFKQAAMALCNELATLFKAQRVSLGIVSDHEVKLRAASGTEHVIRKTDDARAVEAAMEECADQATEVLEPPPPTAEVGADVVSRAARKLARMHGPATVCSTPLVEGERVLAVLTLEMEEDRTLDMRQLETLRLTWELCGPPLLRLHEQDRWIGAKLVTGTRESAAWLVGSKHTWAKLAAAAVLALAVFLIVAHGTYKVDGPFVIEASTLNVIDAPYDGTLESVDAEPGDAVLAGQTVLAQLRTADLKLELAALRADHHRAMKEADLAGREGKEAERQIALAQADQVTAKIQRLEEDLKRAELRSVTDGVVLSGDLKRRIGGRVERGEVLFEVAPLEALRAQVMVPEGQVADVQVGQHGQLAAAADPSRHVGFVVDRIEPMARVEGGQNVFAVRVRLDEVPNWVRPGMEGVAKIDIDRRRYAWIWMRSTLDWLRMKLWW